MMLSSLFRLIVLSSIVLPPLVLNAQAAGHDLAHEYIGSKHSNKFHKGICHFVNSIDKDNLVSWSSCTQAIIEGRIPCKVCRPGIDCEYEFVGSKDGNTFHIGTCPLVTRIRPGALVTWQTFDNAKIDGKIPCEVCFEGYTNGERIKNDSTFFVFLGILLLAVLVSFAYAKSITPAQYAVLKVLLALSAGGVGAKITGIIYFKSNLVQASGGAAIFAIVFLMLPIPPKKKKRSRKKIKNLEKAG